MPMVKCWIKFSDFTDVYEIFTAMRILQVSMRNRHLLLTNEITVFKLLQL